MDEIKQGYSSEDTLDDLNALMYLIKNQVDNRINTIDIVRVINVGDNGTIDVIPVIKDTTPSNEPIEESPIYGIRYIRWQYGVNAIKATPSIGDIGLILVCKKDTSSIEVGLVGSKTKFNLADGIYLGGLNGLNVAPQQFIEFGENTLTITGTGTININATTANINATTVNLGGEGGKAVARAGDNVVSGTTVIGQIQVGSTKVFAVD